MKLLLPLFCLGIHLRRMTDNAHFSVNTRLTRLLGETYRSSEAALKELVDNAWDADARHVWISLPTPVTGDAIVVRDDGSGMTSAEMRGEYLNIASDKRTRSGERTPKYNRRIKGRKGIGKFAGLILAGRMAVNAVARGRQCTIVIDKKELLENQNDLEAVPLPFVEANADDRESGTEVTLSELDTRLNFPTPERLREVLIHEYGREDSFKVFVDDVQLSVEDVPGTTKRAESFLPAAGNVTLHFTIAGGKKLPKAPGIVLKVDGKVVGKPMMFGLDEDNEIPQSLTRRVYGEVEMTGTDDFVTADWGGIIENSKGFQAAKEYVQSVVKDSLRETHARDMALQKARLQRKINRRLEELPEHRRRFAQEAVSRILQRFYGESDERISIVVDVALDAIEHDVYWAVLERINRCSHGDVATFAESLEQFGLVELTSIAQQATRRLEFLEHLQRLIENPKTLEKDVHTALEKNLWVLGRHYSTMSSNMTLKRLIETYCQSNFSGARAAKRPDLLLSQDYSDSFLLIEFKRPHHPITRDDIAQAEKYRDDLSPRLSSNTRMEILMVGKGRITTLDTRNIHESIAIKSYDSLISAARTELNWLISTLSL